MTYDSLVAAHGLSAAHRLVIASVTSAPPGRVLDVGCAGGHLADELRGAGWDVVGLELDASAARARGLTVAEGSVDDPAVRAELPRELDAVVCADVLEHLPQPQETLAFLVTLLRPGGRAVVSLPNAAHWTMRRQLLLGRFPTEDHGLFDRTHLRWFTRESARALLAATGLTLSGESFAPAPLPLEAHVALPASWRRWATAHWPEVFALQVVLTGARP
jgi:2-polyprenyl-3-methyl-5-hydroxy-6-metoxy-1,4-benzoquinol methylase